MYRLFQISFIDSGFMGKDINICKSKYCKCPQITDYGIKYARILSLSENVCLRNKLLNKLKMNIQQCCTN